MSDLPEPLTPPDCDLRDFPFMPIDIQRLRGSKAWLKAKRTPALAFYMINLWTASWHDVPTGSLEDDDDVLADLAMCDPVKWDKLRKDVLHGWIKCSDGRLYNPTVAEKAHEAWGSKLDQRWKTECARIKKHNERHGTKIPRPTFDEWTSQGCPSGQRLYVPRDNSGTGDGQGGETHSKGEGYGQGQGQGQGQGYLDTHTPSVAAQISMAMRKYSIQANPAHPTILAIAEQGVSVETVDACCKETREAKPNETISVAYIAKKLEGWRASAQKVQVAGAEKGVQPANRKPSRHSGFDQIDYREGVNNDGSF